MGITSIFWNRKGAPAGDIFVPTGQTTGYINLPLSDFFTDYINGAAVDLQRLAPKAGGSSGTGIYLYHYTTAGASWRTLAWLYCGTSTGALITHRFQTNFRLPGDYIDNTDLTLHLSSTYVSADDLTEAMIARISMEAYRNIPASGKEGFGYRADPAVDAWTEVDLVTSASPVNTIRHDAGSSEFDQNSFTVDGDNATYPLTPGNLVQVEFTSEIDKDTQNVTLYFANFYVTYDKWAA